MIEKNHFLTNHFLVAMPNLTDLYFRSVVYICEHNEKGAVGIVINQPLQSFRINFLEIIQTIVGSVSKPRSTEFTILCGESSRSECGFVIHAPIGEWQSNLRMNSEICVTTSKDILQAIAKHQGHDKFIFSLDYANWWAGQIEEEIINNFWLTAIPVNSTILFNKRWLETINSVGIDINKLVYSSGHA